MPHFSHWLRPVLLIGLIALAFADSTSTENVSYMVYSK